ncbi:MAG: response regulator [Cyanobacteria bacterium]|nr:response regulator [Cyanobacteriota bacterium]
MAQPTILAVDDSPIVHQLVRRTLGDTYRVLVANNATDALSIVYQEDISLVLLDVSMPDIDGLELCRTVRSLPQFKALPIVMLTGRNGAFDRVQGRLAGASEYLTKPFEADVLRQTISRLLGASVPCPSGGAEP